MGEPSERDVQKKRAEELRSEIEELRRGGAHRLGTPSPREFTDEAAAEASSHHNDAQSTQSED
jgi:hypothetical protein